MVLKQRSVLFKEWQFNLQGISTYFAAKLINHQSSLPVEMDWIAFQNIISMER